MTSRCSAVRGWMTWRTRLLHLLEPALYILWGVILMAVALSRRRPLVALAVGLVLGLAPLTAETLKPLLAHPHARDRLERDRRRVLAERTRERGDGTRSLRGARRPPASASHRRRAGRDLRGGRRLLAAAARLASAERCPRRLSGGHALDGACRGRPARRRGALALTQAWKRCPSRGRRGPIGARDSWTRARTPAGGWVSYLRRG